MSGNLTRYCEEGKFPNVLASKGDILMYGIRICDKKKQLLITRIWNVTTLEHGTIIPDYTSSMRGVIGACPPHPKMCCTGLTRLS
jgi:hypothetical protein